MEEKSALKIALEASGMSIEKISDKTNIRIAVIEDLLNNSVEQLGEGIPGLLTWCFAS